MRARALAGWLQENATVTLMDLRGNQIGDEGARALADGLRANATVTTMYLDHNPMSDAAKQAVLDLVKQNKEDSAAAQARAEAARRTIRIGQLKSVLVEGQTQHNLPDVLIKHVVELAEGKDTANDGPGAAAGGAEAKTTLLSGGVAMPSNRWKLRHGHRKWGYTEG